MESSRPARSRNFCFIKLPRSQAHPEEPTSGKENFYRRHLLNLIALGYFKYLNFLADSIQDLLTNGGPHLAKIALPLGISFSRLLKLRTLPTACRTRFSRTSTPLETIFCLCHFSPPDCRGPILHHRTIIPQFHGTFRDHWQAKLQAGFTLFLLDFSKVIIADHLPPWPLQFLNLHCMEMSLILQQLDWRLSLHTSNLFRFQRIFRYGCRISSLHRDAHPFNFQTPYKSTNIIDFWRTWHISLSNFLRDYLYIPLGGNRKGPSRRYI